MGDFIQRIRRIINKGNYVLNGFILLAQEVPPDQIKVDENKLGFEIPTLSDILTFLVRGVFIVAGLLALLFLLLGAIAWITSGGDKDAVDKARSKITNALIGVILIAVVLAVVVTLEQVVFQRAICLGLSCPITIPALLEPCGTTDGTPCEPEAGSIPAGEIITPTLTPEEKNLLTITPGVTSFESITDYPQIPNTGLDGNNAY